MGRYDNFNNTKNIEKAQKALDKLLAQKKQDFFKIDLARKNLETAKLFESCQIFGREDFWKSEFDPNGKIMFSDDNRVMLFIDKLISYDEIESYAIVENRVSKSHTTTKTTGGITRAVVGGAVAGGVGAVVGAMTAGARSDTVHFETGDGFFLQIFLKNGSGYQYPIPSKGVISNKVPPLWLELGAKLQFIIDENK